MLCSHYVSKYIIPTNLPQSSLNLRANEQLGLSGGLSIFGTHDRVDKR